MVKRPYDIRVKKRNLRAKYKKIRQTMTPEVKRRHDARIRNRILHLPEYAGCKTLLCFVSTAIEVDTHGIINRALRDGKTVAVPYCLEGTRKMHFYAIRSLEELVPRTFGVLEPDPGRCRRIEDFSDSLCILPGIAFDTSGYRLGYGGGYYDRFLSKIYAGAGGATVGICYAACTVQRLPRGRFDVPCNILATEKYMKRLPQPKENGGK